MKHILARVIGKVGSIVYRTGVALIDLSDSLNGCFDETDATEAEVAEMWFNATPTTTLSGASSVTWNYSNKETT